MVNTCFLAAVQHQGGDRAAAVARFNNHAWQWKQRIHHGEENSSRQLDENVCHCTGFRWPGQRLGRV